MELDLVRLFDQKLAVQKTEKKTNSNVFDLFPNELFRLILAKLGVQPLIAIRAVCKRWNSMIENICQDATSIVLREEAFEADIPWIIKHLNGLADFKVKCAVLSLKTEALNLVDMEENVEEALSPLFNSITKLFPKVEHFAVQTNLGHVVNTQVFHILLKHWSSTLVTLVLPRTICTDDALNDHINQLTSLKRIHLPDVGSLKPSTLAQLEHCSFDEFAMSQAVPHLGTNCSSVYLWECAFHSTSIEHITHIAELNPSLVNGLKRWRVSMDHYDSDSQQKFMSFVCDNFVSLQMLSIRFNFKYLFGADTVAKFARLAQLTSLSLDCVYMFLNDLSRCKVALRSVKTLALIDFKTQNEDGTDEKFDGDRFCRVFAAIVPNLSHFTIKHQDQAVCDSIVKNLHHFVYLKTKVVSVQDNFYVHDLGF